MRDEGDDDQYDSEDQCTYGELFCYVLHLFLERRIFRDLLLRKVRYPSELRIHACAEDDASRISCRHGRTHPYAVVPFGE